MATENILVPLCRHSPDLKPLYHSFALAERVNAKIFVLFFKDADPGPATPVEDACIKIVNTACEEGIAASYHITGYETVSELEGFISAEHIHILILGSRDTRMTAAVANIKPAVPVQVIKVEGKGNP